ncbi:Uncharacterised protein [Mycobacteroides abscessus subsp. abscessus]|nr:Uncharacterised protein [Mycobacteroides abscessus subsp. abscessus]
MRARFGCRAELIDAAQNALGIDVLRLGRLHVRLVVQRDVEVHVLAVLAVHPLQAMLDDVRDLVRERRIVSHHSGIGARQ